MHRITVDSKEKSSEARTLERTLTGLGYTASLTVSAVYLLDHAFSHEQLKQIAAALHNPVTETVRIDTPSHGTFDWALELGFLPGVTDNVANTTTDIINDLLGMRLGIGVVFSAKLLYLSAPSLNREDVERIAQQLTNRLIERHHILSVSEYRTQGGMRTPAPHVTLTHETHVLSVDLELSDDELLTLGKKGILDPLTNMRRGALALDLDYLHAIQAYFRKQNRKPTDIEIESIAQTWSEHCKHTIFAAQIDDITEGIFSRYIKKATTDVRRALGHKDFCVSVFKDNAGAIVFDDEFLITHKVETHNSPSALDPFGGAITGIVGVNRDTLGFGLGALPIANCYGFCVGRPEDTTPLYRGPAKTEQALLPRRILDGIVHGINVGGNCSGIPTPTGFLTVDDSYRGKPLVFAGTVGLIPRTLPDGRPSTEKQVQPGDCVVVIGGRVGKDGIHGATFSSEALDTGSPATAVQIGDPITQKKLSDALIKEARDQGLYTSITDNGAGGISCSVAEMAKESGGFVVDLDRVPLKYPGLQPWETWISESQERMTLSVPPEKLGTLTALMASRGVECVAIGTFTDSGTAIVRFHGKEILHIDLEFLHDGLPQRVLHTTPYPYNRDERILPVIDSLALFERILGAHNIASTEFIANQYDHEVQNNSVVKPLQGVGRVNGSGAVIRPRFTSMRGVVLSHALYPRLSEIDCYAMAACAIDTAIRNCVALGADSTRLALLDNFCWCSATDPARLHQLTDAARACYDYAVAFRTPYVSGKDSMFNDFKGFTEHGKPVLISALPTLLISSIGIIDDVRVATTMDLKCAGDLVYVIGMTKDECGGSELYHALEITGGTPPTVDAAAADALYRAMHALQSRGLISACASVNAGGLLITLAKMSLAGNLGVSVDLAKAPHAPMQAERLCYSESQSRFIITIDPAHRAAFEKALHGFPLACAGAVTETGTFAVTAGATLVVNAPCAHLDAIYRRRYAGF